ncbi:MAG TPA: TetR/AcrR family transcriptional regulator [Solirubrobacterales bacterium]|jgi:AcrR family transcriptional regulator
MARKRREGDDAGHPPRRRLSAAERRERILAAATGLIAGRGYGDAPIDAIARAAGVTPPVIYDHFGSKLALYEAVLDSHFANLREIWGVRFPAAELSSESVAASFDAWFAYVEANPDAARILFREPTNLDAAAVHRAVSERSRALVLQPLLGVPASAPLTETGPDIEMTWVVLRGVLQGLALWWVDHPEVPRDRVVDTALGSLWRGWGSVFDGS